MRQEVVQQGSGEDLSSLLKKDTLSGSQHCQHLNFARTFGSAMHSINAIWVVTPPIYSINNQITWTYVSFTHI
jgi:hypothetical protein